MLSPVSRILREVKRGKEAGPLNILTFPTHERYETLLCKTGHNFYSLFNPQLKNWRTDYAPIPENYTIFAEKVPLHLDIDCVLVQSKFGQYEMGAKYAFDKGLPLLCLEHTLPIPFWPKRHFDSVKNRKGSLNIYISEFSVHAWDDTFNEKTMVVHHGINTDLFKPSKVEKSGMVLSVVNDWINRDVFCGFSIWNKIVKKGLPVHVVGDTPGLSKPAKNLEELVGEYQKASVFLNTSQISPVPTSLLEAMSCGVPVVTTGTCMIPSFIENGVNGFMSDDPDVLHGYCQMLLEDEELAQEIGEKGRATILEKFSEQQFLQSWKEVFDKL